MKHCPGCDLDLLESQFSPLKTGKGGLNSRCKACRASEAREKRAANVDAARAADRAKYEKNKAEKLAAIRRYYEANAEAIKEAARLRYAANADKAKAASTAYRRSNKHKVRAWNGTRRAALRMARPKWVRHSEIAPFYAEAHRLEKETGERHHVDHVIPLSHPLVCGLHVPANLRVVPAEMNMRKGNRLEVVD